MTRRDEGGFALVTALWFLALLGLVAVVIGAWIGDALDRATRLKERVAADAALIGAADRLVFMLLSGAASPRGLELVPTAAPVPGLPPGAEASLPAKTPFIALDGRPYRFGSVTARLQDQGGLLDLDAPESQAMERLLVGYGVPVSDAAGLAAALAQYAKRSANLRGATDIDADYRRAGLPPPRHARLITPWELSRILGWRRAEAVWRGPSPLTDMVTIGPLGEVDVNAAPVKVLSAATEIDEREAVRLVAGRTENPIVDLRDLPRTIRPREDRPLQLTPSNMIRLTLSEQSDPLQRVVSVRLTPTASTPYRIDYAVDLPLAGGAALPPALPLPELPPAAPPK